jgi:hypothetical protein
MAKWAKAPAIVNMKVSKHVYSINKKLYSIEAEEPIVNLYESETQSALYYCLGLDLY